MNIIREFEIQRMKNSSFDRFLNIVIKVRMLAISLLIADKLLVTLPEKFEPTIASLENTKDLSKITLA